MVHFFRSSTVDLVQVYLAGQLGHLSGQIDVWAVGQRTSTAGLLPRFVTVADLNKMRSHNNHQAGREPTVGLFNVDSIISLNTPNNTVPESIYG